VAGPRRYKDLANGEVILGWQRLRGVLSPLAPLRKQLVPSCSRVGVARYFWNDGGASLTMNDGEQAELLSLQLLRLPPACSQEGLAMLIPRECAVSMRTP